MILGSLVVACANDTTMNLFMQEIGYFHATANLFAEKLELHFFYRASTASHDTELTIVSCYSTGRA